jgi:hypothetical protein
VHRREEKRREEKRREEKRRLLRPPYSCPSSPKTFSVSLN